MAKATLPKPPAALVKLAANPERGLHEPLEVRFGKNDKVQKLSWPLKSEQPTGVMFVSVNGDWFVADYSRYPQEIKGILEFHGTKQKVGDEYADLDSPEDCMEAARAMDKRLAAGQWFAERGGFSGISVLMQAIMKVFQLSEEKAREFLEPLTTAEKRGLRVSDELRATVEEIEKEKAKKADVSKYLERLRKAAPIGEEQQAA